MKRERDKMVDIDVLKAWSWQDYLISSGERLSMDPELAAANAVSVGQQVRIGVKEKKTDPTAYGVYTVYACADDGTDNDDVRMALAGRQRLNMTDGFDGVLSGCTQVVIHGQDESWLDANNEFGEFLDETNNSHDKVVFCAPHGGVIETKTDEMAKAAYDRLVAASKQASCWRCIGHQGVVGAYDAWHITSTEISRLSFPYLDQIGGRNFTYAVSFHGFGESDIAVGGGAPSSLKTEIANAISNISGLPYVVSVVSSGPYAGVDPANFVNWITLCGAGGIQIELPYSARIDYWQVIAEAVADVFIAKQ